MKDRDFFPFAILFIFKIPLRRTVEKKMKENSWTWGHLERRAPDRSQWHTLTEALCVSKHEED